MPTESTENDDPGIDGHTGVSRTNPKKVTHHHRLTRLGRSHAGGGVRSDYLPLGVDYDLEPVPFVRPRRGRRTALIFPLGPPPQKN
jgi:hypothetical protein